MANKHPFCGVSFDTVIYLGAGQGNDVEDLVQQISADHWHLVEANKDLIKQLEKNVSALTETLDIQLHHNVVSANGEPATWYQYNLPEFSGLNKAKELKDLFPGLKLLASPEVETQSIADLVDKLELDATANNLLIIDLPGQALDLMNALLLAGKKRLFSQFAITATEGQAFDNGGTSQRIKSWLTKQGYHSRNESAEDPDFPVLYYSFDKHSAAAFRDLRKERDDAKEQAAQVKQQLEQLRQQLEQEKQRHEDVKAQAAETKTALEAVTNERDEAKKQTADTNEQLAKVKQQLEQVKSSEAEQHKTLEQLRQQLEQEKQRHEDVKAQAAETATQVKTLNEQKETLEKQKSSLVERRDSLIQANDKLTKTLENTEAGIKQKQEESGKVRAELEASYQKELGNLKRALDGKSERLTVLESEVERYKKLEDNYGREVYRIESQLNLLKEMINDA